MRNNRNIKNKINATKIELPQNKSLAENSNKPKEIHMKLSDFKELKAKEEKERNKQEEGTINQIKVPRKSTNENNTRTIQKKKTYDNEKPNKKEKRKKRSYTEEELEEIRIRKRMVNYVTGVFVLIFIITGIVIATGFSIEDIEVTGNVHYTKEEIVEIVTADGYIDNSLLLHLKNKFKPIENVPFVDKLDIEYVSNHKITITIYEKAMAGCIEYMDEYVYFDKEGIVLETSNKKMSDIPCIRGMTFDTMTLHSKLPIDDANRFKLILNITQLLDKYELNIDSIRFTSDDEIILNYSNIKILLGKGENIDAQLVDLGNILEKLEGKKGTLNMKDFTDSKKLMIFKADE